MKSNKLDAFHMYARGFSMSIVFRSGGRPSSLMRYGRNTFLLLTFIPKTECIRDRRYRTYPVPIYIFGTLFTPIKPIVQ